MDKSNQSTDKLLSQVLQQCEGQELKFLDTVFGFLNRRSSFLAHPNTPTKVIQLVHNHIDVAKKREIQNQSLNQKEESKTSGITSKTKRSITEEEAQKLEEKELENLKKTEKSADDAKPKMSMDLDELNESDSDLVDCPEGNGGTTDKYKWTQSLDEVEVSIPIDANLRGKHLKIVIKKRLLFVAIKGKESTPLINGELKDAVNVEESTWILDKESGKNTKTIVITLQKLKGMNWWDCVIKGDPTIDTAKIQPENSKLDSLDPDTRQTVEKMMFDQRQKMKGLPTSKELEQQTILEKFKRQHPEMDFSNLKMAPDSLNAFAK
eukprot:91922_1